MNVYLYKNDEQFGPYSLEQVQAYLDDGSFTPIDSAWFNNCKEWTTVSHLPGIVISEEKRRQHLVPPFEAYAGDKPYVFVSYAHADGELVFREIRKLHEAGYRIWYDEGIDPGKDWPEHIAKAVINCSLFLMFTSPRSVASENCRNEVNLALNRKKKFLAIYLEETELPPGLELRMGDLQSILKFRMPDATYHKKVFSGLENLLGKDGRDLPEGDDPVAAAMAVEIDGDYLLAPIGEGEITQAHLTMTKGLWIGVGTAIVLLLAWFFYPKDGKGVPESEKSNLESGETKPNLISVPWGQQTPAGYVLLKRGEFKWRELSSVSVARTVYDGVEVLDGKIFCVGGYLGSSGGENLAERYDPGTGKWETLEKMSVTRSSMAAAVRDGKFYAIGGTGLSSVEIYDPETGVGQWSEGPELPLQVGHGNAITVGEKILLVGGNSSNENDKKRVLELNPSNSKWRYKSPMPTARGSLVIVPFGEKLWAIGGDIGGDRLPTDKVEIYDITTDAWSLGPALTNKRKHPSAWVSNGMIYVAGGYDGSSYLKSIEAYDPHTKQWVAAGNLPEIKYGAAAVVLGDKVYLVAGKRSKDDYSQKVHVADLTLPKDLYIRDPTSE